MLMGVGFDTGDMLLKDEVEITENMTNGELHDILTSRGGDLLIETIEGLVNGQFNQKNKKMKLVMQRCLKKILV